MLHKTNYKDLIILVFLAISFFSVKLWINDEPLISNDSCQYFSIADNALKGNIGYTSIIHFDSERSHAVIPAPVTTFPIGYSLILASISSLGFSLYHAGIIINVICLMFFVLFLVKFTKIFELNKSEKIFLYAWIIGNSTLYLLSVKPLSEFLFTFITTFSILLFIISDIKEKNRDSYIYLVLIANVLVGLSCWVRYAGLFLFVTITVFYLLKCLMDPSRDRFITFSCTSVSAVIIFVGLLRNHILVGTWKGGNTVSSHANIFDVIIGFVKSVFHVTLGDQVALSIGIFEILISISILILCVYLAKFIITKNKLHHVNTLILLSLYIVIYCAALIYTAINSPVSIESTRLFFPVLIPTGMVISLITINLRLNNKNLNHQKIISASLIVFSISYSVINANNHLHINENTSKYRYVSQILKHGEENSDIVKWINSHIKPDDDNLAANYGQMTGLVLQNNMLSLVSRRFSKIRWNHDVTKKTFNLFNIKYLILFRQPNNNILKENTFLMNLSAIREIPDWLTITKYNGNVVIYRLK